MHLRRAPLTAVLTAALLTAGTAAAGTAAAAAGTAAAPAAVPWHQVGPGWVLAQYTSAHPDGGPSGPETLDLISPSGTKYQLARWPDARTAPVLIAWSPDGKHALFRVFSGKGGTEVLTLATGQQTTFLMPGLASPVGFTTPDGLNIVGSRPSGNQVSLARYTLSGQLARSLGISADGTALYQPSGAGFLTGASHGLKLVSNNGTQI